jgi:phosphopantetheinyl transferase (holo-ACP synthase)
MTRTADGDIAENSTRLDFAIAGVDAWRVELDQAHRRTNSRDVLVALLARSLECDRASILFRRDGWGKPHLLNQPNLHVNVSRSGSQLLVAIASRPVGVDVEVVRPVVDRTALSTLHLTPFEWGKVLAADEDRRDELFLVAWTRKEACAKAIGAGLRIPPALIASGVDRGLTRTRIPFQKGVHVVDVESTLSAGNAVVSLAVLLTPMPAPDVENDLR